MLKPKKVLSLSTILEMLSELLSYNANYLWMGYYMHEIRSSRPDFFVKELSDNFQKFVRKTPVLESFY